MTEVVAYREPKADLLTPIEAEKFNSMTKFQIQDFLEERGWSRLWSDDNWVKNEWKTNKDCNIDWMGLSTEHAFAVVSRQKIVDNSVKLF